MEKSTDIREELLLLYQVTVADLSYFKTQQWSVTNYTLLIFAALVAVTQLLEPLSFHERLMLSSLAVTAMAAGLIILSKLQRSISIRQTRLAATKDKFSASFKEAWAAEMKGPEYVHSIFFLYTAITIGGILGIWLIAFRL